MNDVKITITNSDQIRRAMRLAPALMASALPQAINKSLLLIGGKAARNAPVRTGNLRSSILDPHRGLQLARNSIFSGSVGSGVGYGGFVEYGTRFMRAQPFLRPAVEGSGYQVDQFFIKAVNDVLSQIAGQT